MEKVTEDKYKSRLSRIEWSEMEFACVDRLLFGDAVGVAVLAFHEVDVVRTGSVFEGGVHFFDVEAAIGKARMTGAATGARLQPVFQVAGHAAESFVDADGSSVVAGTNLRSGQRRVALIAERLTLIGAAVHAALLIEQLG